MLRLISPLLLIAACGGGFSDPSRELGPTVDGPASGRVQIHQPATLGVLETSQRDINGVPVGVACDTCHGPDSNGTVLADDQGNPEEMHASVDLAHGDLVCNSCHDPRDRRYLHLADGTQLEQVDAQRLCAQCHGIQYRDYVAGAHGGMTGAWDLRRGDRVRNHCLDCHKAHAPAYPKVQSVFRPQDRGITAMRDPAHADQTHADQTHADQTHHSEDSH